MSTSIDITPKSEIIWDDEVELTIMLDKYQTFSKHSYTFLSIAKDYEWYNSTLQLLIICLGLVISFVSAISGINDQVKIYITSSFALLSSVLAGILRIKNFGEKFGTYNIAYKDYKEITTDLRNLLTTLKSDKTYEELNISLTKKESQHEILLPRETLQKEDTGTEGKLFIENVRTKIREQHQAALDKKNAARQQMADLFINRKKEVFGYEIRTRLYEKYIVESIFKDNAPREDLKTYDNYISWLRVTHADYYTSVLDKFKDYQDEQIAVYYIDSKIFEQNYDYDKIEEEAKMTKIMVPSEDKFEKMLSDKFKEYSELIRTQVYTKEEYGQYKYSYNNFISKDK